MDNKTAINIIKSLLVKQGKKQTELAQHFGLSVQSLNNKLCRGSLSLNDLKTIAEFLNCKLAYITSENDIVEL